VEATITIMAPYSFFNGLWIGGKSKKNGISTNNSPSEFDGTWSGQGEANFMAENFQQDYESGETQRIIIKPERMGMDQTLDPAVSLIDGAGDGSGKANFMEHDHHRDQDHNYGQIRRIGNEEEHMEASQILNVDKQLATEAGGDEVALQSRYRDQNYHHHAEETQYTGQDANSMDVNHSFDPASRFTNGAAPGNAISMEVDHHDEGGELESIDASGMSNTTYQFMKEVESRNVASANQNFSYSAGQIQQLENSHNKTEQGPFLNNEAQSSMIKARNMALWHELQLVPHATFQPALSSNEYNFRMSAHAAQPGQIHINLSDPRFLAQGAHVADPEHGNATQGAMYSQNANGPHPRSSQGAQHPGHGYGSPSQRRMTSQQNFNNSSLSTLSCNSDPRIVAQHQPQKALNLLPGMNASGHAHIAKPFKANDDATIVNLCDSSDDEPLRTRTRRRIASASHRSTPSAGSQTGAQDVANTAAESENESEEITFDFKLPTYEATYEKDAAGRPSAKVSLPGLVRETVLLNPDHSEHEHQLFLNVFLPSHLARATPDPEPALAVLNFHTIATLVIDSYKELIVQRNQGLEHLDQELEHLDTDEVFFQAIDRWRVGMSFKRENYELIRGVQEFCDVGLDLVFWVKEHGMWTPPPKERKERSDKGAARRPKTSLTDTADTAKGTKKAVVPAARKVNELQARKKELAKAKEKGKPGPKPKAKLGRPPGHSKKNEKKEREGKVTVVKASGIRKRK
jgi:hypothetical protein